MAEQKLELQLKGLYTSPSYLSGAPEGSFEIADNVVINAKNIVDSRRGQKQYNEPLDVGMDGEINKLFNYASSLIVNYSEKLAYDDGIGGWTDYSGTYEAPEGFKMRSLEALQNFYYTTDRGIYKIDELAGTPRRAGVVRALGGVWETDGTTGFLLDDSAVAYRMLWGYRDANNNLIRGAPSQRIVASNSSGNPTDIELTFIIPDTITTEYFYQIYRSQGTATALDEPSDELQLVIEGNPTSGEIAAKSFTVVDITPYSLMRETLYTSPSQEGIQNANNEPPLACDMDIFKDSAFYANITYKQTLSLALIGVEFPSLGYFVDATVDTTTSNAVLTNISDTSDLRVGMRVVGTGIPTTARILNILSPTSITMTVNATASATVSVEFQDRFSIGGVDYWAASASDLPTLSFFVDASGTPGQNINNTANNLIQIINTASTNTTLYGYYISGIEDLPGQMLFEERAIGGTAFVATSTFGASFSPPLPTSGTTVSSMAETFQNRVAISKPSQVEAVPSYTYFNIGSANFPIDRVVALRDGIFFFKQDGIYRLSGEAFSSFTVSLVDNTVTLKVKESAVPFNNQVFCCTTQGICAVTDAGVQIMSVPIENTLLELSSDQFVNFAEVSFGVAYESARQYIFFTVTDEADTVATQAFVYNSLTDTWTKWIMDRTCGIVNPAVNKLFMAAPADDEEGQVLIERKSYTTADYADQEYAVTIVSVDSDTQITLSDASGVATGMTLGQGSRTSVITAVDTLLDTIEVLTTTGFAAGNALVFEPIDNFIRWNPIAADNPGIMKHFSECTFFFRDARFNSIESTFETNLSASTEIVPLGSFTNSPWGGFLWGLSPWGGSFEGRTVLRTYIPREKQRCSWLSIGLRLQQAFSAFSLQGVSIVYNTMSSRVR